MTFQDPNSGGFGSSDNPDLSNPWKKARYEQFKSGQGEFTGVDGGGAVDIAKQLMALSDPYRKQAISTLEARTPEREAA